MAGWPLLMTLALLSFSASTLQEDEQGGHCPKAELEAHSLKLFLKGRRNSTGEWESDFYARKEIRNSSRNLNLEVEYKIFECNGKTVLHIGGSGEGKKTEMTSDALLFNEKCGKNAVIINKARTAFRMDPVNQDGYGILLSGQPLIDNEVFQVRLESKISKWGGNSIGIGVTAVNIDSFTPPLWMMEVKSNTWMMYNEDIYVNGNKKLNNYGKNLGSLKPGDTLGVMRTNSGELHIFVNGVDQGIAASGIPNSVFGVVDLIRDFVSVTIV